MTLTSAARAIVFNGAIDATPPGGGGTTGGASVQKYIDPSTALNGSEITAKCLEPDDSDANGFYRSPCLDSSTPLNPADTVTARFDTGATINYRVVISNSGAVALTGVNISDCAAYEGTSCTATWPAVSANCPARPNSLAVASAAYACTYSKTAPSIPDSSATKNFVNNATVTANEISPAVSAVTAQFEKPADLRVVKWVSPYPLGNDGDGTPSFGTGDISMTYTGSTGPVVWYYVGITNVGAKSANNVAISDTMGAIPFGQNNATAVCDANPGSMAAGAAFTCRYQRTLQTGNAARANTVSVTSSNVVPNGDDSATRTVDVSQCTGGSVVPNMIGMTKTQATTAWTTAGFKSNKITTWSNFDTDVVLTQDLQAGLCQNANSATVTVKRVITP